LPAATLAAMFFDGLLPELMKRKAILFTIHQENH